jgi:pyruvate,water dikinase
MALKNKSPEKEKSNLQIISLEGLVVSESMGYTQGIAIKEDCRVEGNKDYILILENASTEHFDLILKANGIISRNGGMLSHLAILARELSIPYICGIDIDKIENGDMIYMYIENGFGKSGKIEVIKHKQIQ